MNKINVLITAVGTQSMPGLADCFHNNFEREIRLVGADMSNDQTICQMVDVLYQVPRVTDPNYINALLEICEKEKIDIFFPFMDEELELVHDNIERFNNLNTKVAIASREAIEITNNKLKFYDFLRENGIYVPEYYKACSIEELEIACAKLGYPEKSVCVKTLDGSGSRGIRILDSKIDLYDLYVSEKPNTMFTTKEAFISMLSGKSSIKEMMVMEYLPGAECSVDILADNGEIVYMVGRESNNVLASIPQDCELKVIPAAYDICTKITKLLKLDGNADFDFKYNSNGEPVLMEINPRLAATLSVIAVGGINLPYLRVKQLLGEELPDIKPQYGIRLKRRYLDMFIDENGKKAGWDNVKTRIKSSSGK